MNPHLIEWAAAHKIAYQAAAAFRPSYFDGPGFMAHPWVVEAIRSAHMDGERYAQGLPPIDRSGALPIEVREQRLAKRALPSSDEPKWTAELVATVERLAEEIRAKLEPKPMADPTPQPSDAPQQGVPIGWKLSRLESGAITVNGPPGGCVVQETATERRAIPEELLHALASALIDAATAQQPQPAEQGEDAAPFTMYTISEGGYAERWIARKDSRGLIEPIEGPWRATEAEARAAQGQKGQT